MDEVEVFLRDSFDSFKRLFESFERFANRSNVLIIRWCHSINDQSHSFVRIRLFAFDFFVWFGAFARSRSRRLMGSFGLADAICLICVFDFLIWSICLICLMGKFICSMGKFICFVQ